MVENITADTIELNNGIRIEIHTASFRSVRGYTVVAALCDEIAFWRSEDSANPDTEILAALRPAMATIPDALMLCFSTPYARRGVLWNAYRQHFGKGGDVLVWQAPTRAMNPTVPQSVIDNAFEEDPTAAAAEYGAEFRSRCRSIHYPGSRRCLYRTRPFRAAAGRWYTVHRIRRSQRRLTGFDDARHSTRRERPRGA